MAKKAILILFYLFISFISWSQVIYEDLKPIMNRGTEDFLKDYLSIKYPNRKFTDFIYVGVKRQELIYLEEVDY